MKKPSANSTLPAICERYFDLRAALWAPRTVANRRRTILRFIRFLHGKDPRVRRWGQLRREHIEAWLIAIRHRHPRTRLAACQILGQFLEDLIGWRWPHRPPPGLFRDTDRPRVPLTLPTPLEPRSDQRLQDYLAAEDSMRSLALRLLRQTGLRVGELLNLPLDAYRPMGEGLFVLRVPPGKTYTERLFPLAPPTCEILEHLIGRRGCRAPTPVHSPWLLIEESGRRLSYYMLWRHLKDSARQAGVANWPKVHLHQLRHTFATELARAEIPLPSLMALLGHRRPDMTMHYVRLNAQDVRRAYEQALARLPALCAPPPSPAPAARTAPASAADELASLIHRLEHCRRDQPTPQARPMLRLIKRLRAALAILKNIA